MQKDSHSIINTFIEIPTLHARHLSKEKQALPQSQEKPQSALTISQQQDNLVPGFVLYYLIPSQIHTDQSQTTPTRTRQVTKIEQSI